MAEFFLELFSEEIPARMQKGGAGELERILKTHLEPLEPRNVRTWYGPRRIAIAADLLPETPASEEEVRGPRVGAPEAAINGFLSKHVGQRADLVEKNGFYFIHRKIAPTPAKHLVIAPTFIGDVWKLPWPKSMRWGQSAKFTWVRPLRRVVCLLGGQLVSTLIGPVDTGYETEGHRFMAPDAFVVESAEQWESELERRFVIADAGKRRVAIEKGLRAVAAERGLTVVSDPALLEEVTGLVEWPVCLLGAVEPGQMALPPEVRELSMKVNQRYFATRDAAGKPAPFFAFVANIEANDGGAAIVAGNERVLRARLADAEHFWALDRKQKLDAYLPKLDSVIFHAKLGTQLARASRISALARDIALGLGADEAAAEDAARAGLLCKADLVTGMVGEFPELQGIMGGYYAEASGEGEKIAGAISTHYQPKGPSDEVPRGMVACAVALADKVDTLREFFRIGEKPTGSGDPYALRRAALGVLRIILENKLKLDLLYLAGGVNGLFEFIAERLGNKLRSEGDRPDVIDAVFAATGATNLFELMQIFVALKAFLTTDDGKSLLIAYRRAANILRIETAKDGPHRGLVDADLLSEPAEIALADALTMAEQQIVYEPGQREFGVLLKDLAALRAPVDAFFDHVTVNVTGAKMRRNRLRLLARLRDVMHRVADFSRLEG